MVPPGVFSSTPGHDYDFARSVSDAAVNRFLCLAAFVILYYDYLLTLPLEVERYWGERFNRSWTTVFFFLGRYFPLFGQTPVIVLVVLPRNIEKLCTALVAYHQVYIIASEVIVCILLLLRTYALYNRNRKMAALLFVISATLLSVGCWAVTRRSSGIPDEPPEIGCNIALSNKSAYNLLVAWSCLFAFDMAIFFLTLLRALSLRNDGARPLMEVILRDGTMYFGALAIAYLSNILTFIHGTALTKGVTSTLANVLATVLISRLMLNIRKPDLVPLGRGRSRTWTTTSDPSGEIVTSVFPSAGVGRWTSRGSDLDMYDRTVDIAPLETFGGPDDIELIRRDAYHGNGKQPESPYFLGITPPTTSGSGSGSGSRSHTYSA